MKTLVAILTAVGACAQAPETFEVATVKPANPATHPGSAVEVLPGGLLKIHGLPLKSLVVAAYGMAYQQVTGGERWMEDVDYDIEAKPAADAGITDLRHGLYDISSPRLRAMLQSLLAERFKLRVRRDIKEGDVYRLVKSGKTLRLQPSEVQIPTGEKRDGASSIGRAGRWVIARTTMPQLAQFASTYVVRSPVEDRTELAGAFDYWQPESNAAPQETDHTDSFLYLLDEIGLKLEKARGTVETLLIESAAKPSDN